MAKVEKSANANKFLHKLVLCVLRVMPLLIAGCYFLNTTLSYIGIDTPCLSYIGGLSLLPWLFLYLSSFAFKFCSYHRMPLYYVLVSDCISYYDLWIGIPLEDRTLFVINEMLAGIFLLMALYLKFKVCKRL